MITPPHTTRLAALVIVMLALSGCVGVRRLTLQQQIDDLGPAPEDDYDLEITRCDLNTEPLTGGMVDVEPGERVMIEAVITNTSDHTRRFDIRLGVRPLGLDADVARRPGSETAPIDPGESWTYTTKMWHLEGEDFGYECIFDIWDSYTDLIDPPAQPTTTAP